jgi:hypothetical protein
MSLLAACSVEVDPPKSQQPDIVGVMTEGTVRSLGSRHESRAPGCGPYFIVIPEATETKRLDLIIFFFESTIVGGVPFSSSITVTIDRIRVVVDEARVAPHAKMTPGVETVITMSQKDYDEAPCLRKGTRI